MTIQFATTNTGKFETMERLFQSYGISVTQAHLDIPEIQAKSVKEIAEHKTKSAFGLIKKPCMAQDSGFYLHAWKGFPGPYIKDTLETLGIEGILKLRQKNDPGCEFCEAHTYFDGSTLKTFTGTVSGVLSERPRGERQEGAWSDLWLIFKPNGWDRTIAEMTNTEQNKWRAERGETAAAACAKWLARKI